jgi:hypothetical protein
MEVQKHVRLIIFASIAIAELRTSIGGGDRLASHAVRLTVLE